MGVFSVCIRNGMGGSAKGLGEFDDVWHSAKLGK